MAVVLRVSLRDGFRAAVLVPALARRLERLRIYEVAAFQNREDVLPCKVKEPLGAVFQPLWLQQGHFAYDSLWQNAERIGNLVSSIVVVVIVMTAIVLLVLLVLLVLVVLVMLVLVLVLILLILLVLRVLL